MLYGQEGRELAWLSTSRLLVFTRMQDSNRRYVGLRIHHASPAHLHRSHKAENSNRRLSRSSTASIQPIFNEVKIEVLRGKK